MITLIQEFLKNIRWCQLCREMRVPLLRKLDIRTCDALSVQYNHAARLHPSTELGICVPPRIKFTRPWLSDTKPDLQKYPRVQDDELGTLGDR